MNKAGLLFASLRVFFFFGAGLYALVSVIRNRGTPVDRLALVTSRTTARVFLGIVGTFLTVIGGIWSVSMLRAIFG